jgi:hypothetical protein
MAFENEFITDQDRAKYGLDLVEGDIGMQGKAPQNHWTIDHERGMYLRLINRGREEFRNTSTWHFYWSGELMTVCLEMLDAGGQRGGHGWSHYKLTQCYGKGDFVPKHLGDQRKEILDRLREALLAYKDGGVFSSIISHSTTLTS